ncbi:hypothetical protein N8214_03420 [Pseudomonadales bacterium]|jgi:hypothetical protein|nr:hypothetical protein [Pseudomonadales bacterium]
MKVASILEFLHIRSPKLFIGALRLVSILAKGLLLLLCSKILSERDLVEFAVILGVANFTVLFSGIDITRWFQKLVSLGAANEKITTSILTHTLLSFCAGMLMWIVYLDWSFFGFLVALYVLFEAVSQEAGRQFIVLNKQSVVAFLNLWKSLPPFILVAVVTLADYDLLVEELIMALVVSSLASLSFSFISLRKHDIALKIDPLGVAWKDIVDGSKFGFYFFVSTILMKSLLTLDKGFVVSKVGEYVGSSYIVWMACFVVIIPVYEIFVGSWSIPKFFYYFNNRNMIEFKSLAYRSTLQCAGLWMLLFIAVNIFIKVFFKEYDNIDTLTLFLISFFVLEYVLLQILGTLNQVLEEKIGQLVSSILGLIVLGFFVVINKNSVLSLHDIAVFGCTMLGGVILVRYLFLSKRINQKCLGY